MIQLLEGHGWPVRRRARRGGRRERCVQHHAGAPALRRAQRPDGTLPRHGTHAGPANQLIHAAGDGRCGGIRLQRTALGPMDVVRRCVNVGTAPTLMSVGRSSAPVVFGRGRAPLPPSLGPRGLLLSRRKVSMPFRGELELGLPFPNRSARAELSGPWATASAVTTIGSTGPGASVAALGELQRRTRQAVAAPTPETRVQCAGRDRAARVRPRTHVGSAPATGPKADAKSAWKAADVAAGASDEAAAAGTRGALVRGAGTGGTIAGFGAATGGRGLGGTGGARAGSRGSGTIVAGGGAGAAAAAAAPKAASKSGWNASTPGDDFFFGRGTVPGKQTG